MRRECILLLCAVLAAGCGSPRRGPGPESNEFFNRKGPDWIKRSSGIFPGPGGSSTVEGIAVAKNTGNRAKVMAEADALSSKEVERILRLRLTALLPATQDSATLPPLKVTGRYMADHWREPETGAIMGLCVLDRDGVKKTIEASFAPGSLRDYMLVQLDKILAK